MKERLHWLSMHAVVRGAAAVAARRGDPQARLMADPAVRADPVPFYDELRTMGPLIRTQVGYLTVDHAVAYDLLRSDDFRVITFGSTLKAPLRRLERATRPDLLHPLLPPSLLVVWSRPITPATARRCPRCSPPARSPGCGRMSSRPPPS